METDLNCIADWVSKVQIVFNNRGWPWFNFYLGLFEETYQQTQFLNQLPANVIERSIEVFRENLYDVGLRKQIPHQIYQILEAELIEEQKSELYQEMGDKGVEAASEG